MFYRDVLAVIYFRPRVSLLAIFCSMCVAFLESDSQPLLTDIKCLKPYISLRGFCWLLDMFYQEDIPEIDTW